MSDLKACPFCGRIPDIEDCGEHRWFIRCKCGIAQDKLFYQKCDAVRAWNKRKELRVKDTNVPITDTISRQAAIEKVRQLNAIVSPISDDMLLVDQAEVMTELIMLPSAQPEYTIEMQGADIDETMKRLRDARVTIPLSVQPERMKGKWIYGENDCQDGWFCSECRFFIPWDYDYYGLNNINFIKDFHVCPHCKAEMMTYTGKKEDTDEHSG